MSTLATLAVNVVADTGGFGQPIKGARHELGLFEGAAHKVGHSLAHLATGFAAGLSIHHVIHEVQHATESLLEMGHAAGRLDIGTEALGGLEHAGRLAHISNEEMIKDLTFMEKNVGKNSKALGALGLNFEALEHMKADQMFLSIAEKIEHLPTAAERTTAAIAVFGKSGAEMLKLIGEGADEIRLRMAEVKGTGLAPTEEEIKRIEKADRAYLQALEHLKSWWQDAAIYAAQFGAEFIDAQSSAAKLAVNVDKVVDRMDPKTIAHFQQTLKDWDTMGAGGRAMQLEKNPTVEFAGIIGQKNALELSKGDAFFTAFDAFVKSMEGRMGRDAEKFGASLAKMEADYKAAIKARDDLKPEHQLGAAWSTLSGVGSHIMGKWNDYGDRTLLPKSLTDPTSFQNEATMMKFYGMMRPFSLMGGILGQNIDEFAGVGEEKKHGFGGNEVAGFHLIEAGTAEAFSQDRRSTLAAGGSGVAIAKESLAVEKEQLRELKDIKKIAPQKLEIINIA